MKIYALTKEGEQYAADGLPEVNLVKMLDKPLPIQALQKSMNNFLNNLFFLNKYANTRQDCGSSSL